MENPIDLPPLPSWKTRLWIVAAFFGATLLVYGHSMTNDFVRWDDGMLVYENPAIREISGRTLKHIFTTYDPELYIPFTFFTYQLNFLFGGADPFIYHVTNLLFHTGSSILVAWLLYLLSKRSKLAIFCELLFAIHPLHTEAVEWVSARKDVLSTFFFLLSIIGYLYWRENDRPRTLVGSLIAFTLGLMSKVMVITLPVVLLMIDWLQGRKMSIKMFTEKIPYFALSALFGIIGVVGKTGVIESSSTTSKILMACKSAVFYLQKIFFPVRLSLLYPYGDTITVTSPDFYIPILILAVIAALVLLSLRWTRVIAFGFAFFLVTVGPTFINFAKGGELDIYFASDRYSYVPSIGIFFAVAWMLWRLVEWIFGENKTTDRALQVGSGLLIALLGFLAFRQSQVWRNTTTLFENVIKYYPEASYVAHNNLGNAYRLNNDLETAIVQYQKAIAIKPNVKTISNLGAVYRRQSKFDAALAEYDKALAINDKSKEAKLGLGLVYMNLKRYPEAQKEFSEAAKIDPSYEEAHTNLGASLMAQGKIDDAIDAYNRALAVNPFFPDAHYNLAVALSELGRKEEAIAGYEAVVRMVPNIIPARINLGLLYFETGEPKKARRQFEEILKIDPQNAAAKSAIRQIDQARR